MLAGFVAGIVPCVSSLVVNRLIEAQLLAVSQLVLVVIGYAFPLAILGASLQGAVSGALLARERSSFGLLPASSATIAVMDTGILVLLSRGEDISPVTPVVLAAACFCASLIPYAMVRALLWRAGRA